jgi:hypothetical protein
MIGLPSENILYRSDHLSYRPERPQLFSPARGGRLVISEKNALLW